MPDPAEIVRPDIDRDALMHADMAFIDTDGSPPARVRAAVAAYLYTVANTRDDHGMQHLPSWQEVRDYLKETP